MCYTESLSNISPIFPSLFQLPLKALWPHGFFCLFSVYICSQKITVMKKTWLICIGTVPSNGRYVLLYILYHNLISGVPNWWSTAIIWPPDVFWKHFKLFVKNSEIKVFHKKLQISGSSWEIWRSSNLRLALLDVNNWARLKLSDKM